MIKTLLIVLSVLLSLRMGMLVIQSRMKEQRRLKAQRLREARLSQAIEYCGGRDALYAAARRDKDGTLIFTVPRNNQESNHSAELPTGAPSVNLSAPFADLWPGGMTPINLSSASLSDATARQLEARKRHPQRP